MPFNKTPHTYPLIATITQHQIQNSEGERPMIERTGKSLTEIILEDFQLETLKNLRKALYSENRMSGDQMRDYAQALDAIIRDIEACQKPYPECQKPELRSVSKLKAQKF